jgi:hypothetical protein
VLSLIVLRKRSAFIRVPFIGMDADEGIHALKGVRNRFNQENGS